MRRRNVQSRNHATVRCPVTAHGFAAKEGELVLQGALATLATLGQPCRSLSLVLVNDTEIRRLNRIYRECDRVTDVVSFYYASGAPLEGDVFIGAGRSRRQARDIGHSWQHELLYLVIHGVLHVAGYTDYEPQNKKKMFAVQNKVFGKACNIPAVRRYLPK